MPLPLLPLPPPPLVVVELLSLQLPPLLCVLSSLGSGKVAGLPCVCSCVAEHSRMSPTHQPAAGVSGGISPPQAPPEASKNSIVTTEDSTVSRQCA